MVIGKRIRDIDRLKSREGLGLRGRLFLVA